MKITIVSNIVKDKIILKTTKIITDLGGVLLSSGSWPKQF